MAGLAAAMAVVRRVLAVFCWVPLAVLWLAGRQAVEAARVRYGVRAALAVMVA